LFDSNDDTAAPVELRPVEPMADAVPGDPAPHGTA